MEGCILAVIQREEIYGYELSVRLAEQGFTFVSEGSIYPLLQRLQRDGLIKGKMQSSTAGPKRKYYSLTAEGENVLQEFRDRWRQVQGAVGNILEGGNAGGNDRDDQAQ